MSDELDVILADCPNLRAFLAENPELRAEILADVRAWSRWMRAAGRSAAEVVDRDALAALKAVEG